MRSEGRNQSGNERQTLAVASGGVRAARESPWPSEGRQGPQGAFGGKAGEWEAMATQQPQNQRRPLRPGVGVGVPLPFEVCPMGRR